MRQEHTLVIKHSLKATLEHFRKEIVTFQFNSMFVSKIKDIISNFGLDWNPLARPIYIHNIHPKQHSDESKGFNIDFVERRLKT